MKIIKVKDYKELSETAARLILEKVRANPQLVLGLATGGTPEGMYEQLVTDHRTAGTSYQQITTFNLDEYAGLPREDRNSYYTYMRQQLFDHIDIPEENVHLPNGETEDLQAECRHYEQLIKEAGDVDLQILGIGGNGHIGFNEPGTSFDSVTHVVTLDESTREANARYFSSLDEVPTHAVTMGIQTIMRAKEIVLLVSGESKADAIVRLLTEEANESFPASALLTHPNVTLIVDEEALKKVDQIKTN
ncbi:glucosamine-6-phosphate deaminase [Pseudobacillus wudalianchiensis]|uniref:Glucosamine-6-phosphate deaminase n=1 Tax=Pseudobacillus wudalianchiensis TaxID=1743143 RepID=A0A1B9B6I0_9BACI|nr:glucosamine-6-phosphate deaminase [Bacillus wudalianchiensis]OCA91706.1 glucosamine-6-phosphate deaminase [Bacillus wudalianchiensis]